jgi:hypothetical protein
MAGVCVSAAPFKRGDANANGKVDVADAVTILSHLFLGKMRACEDALDISDNGKIDIADAVRLVGYLFGGSPRPPEPFLECGDDPTLDALDCIEFDDQVCPSTPPLVVTGVTPATGPAAGDAAIVIAGSGFSYGTLQVSLCGKPLLNLVVVSDTRIEAVTPAGEPLQACLLSITDDSRATDLPSAFTYESVAPPVCVQEADVAQSFSTLIDQTICLPSPLFTYDLMGSAVVMCPTGSLCTGGQAGCDFTFKSAGASVNLAERKVTAEFTGIAVLPVDIGTTMKCTATMNLVITLNADLNLQPTQWDTIDELMSVGNVTLTLASLDVSATGGLLCGLLNLSGTLIEQTIQGLLDTYTEQLFTALNAQLGGIYVCKTP